jgi:hypothetical protein
MRLGRHLTPRYIYHRTYVELFRRRQLRAGEQSVPLLAIEAVEFLDGWLRDTDVMLEYGAGGSTRWFGRRVRQLSSIESDQGWFDKIHAQTSHLPNVEIHLFKDDWARRLDDSDLPDWRVEAPEGYVEFLASVPDETFDVILDDGCGRDAVGVRAIRTLKRGGLLVWDDDPPAHGSLVKELRDWRAVTFQDGTHRTNLFFKPGVGRGPSRVIRDG